MVRFPIVVVGASAGGVEAVSRVVHDLPANLPAALFVAVHFPPYSASTLPRILSRAGRMPASHPTDGEPIQTGRVYVSPPDRHLIIGPERIRLGRGPKENGNRPAIDPLFRSAAVTHGPRVIGVVLTGNLDDGTSGLLAIKRRGGTAIVQDPHDAPFPSMPTSAIGHVRVDHVLPLNGIGELIEKLVMQRLEHPAIPVSPLDAMPDAAPRETAYAAADLNAVEDPEHHPGTPSQFGCPDCGGVLWEIKDGQLTRFRCRVGHAYTSEGLAVRQSERLDEALWAALRALEESASLTRFMAQRARKQGNDVRAANYDRDAQHAEQKASVVRDRLLLAQADERRHPDKLEVAQQ
ncbi:MAG: chemotaxis protein CheB [Gemmatimonadaceae bacterium]